MSLSILLPVFLSWLTLATHEFVYPVISFSIMAHDGHVSTNFLSPPMERFSILVSFRLGVEKEKSPRGSDNGFSCKRTNAFGRSDRDTQ